MTFSLPLSYVKPTWPNTDASAKPFVVKPPGSSTLL
jgi:hypothetical protein